MHLTRHRPLLRVRKMSHLHQPGLLGSLDLSSVNVKGHGLGFGNVEEFKGFFSGT